MGSWHSSSILLIGVNLDKRTSLLDVLDAVFPGGSITGAPKVKVVDLLKKA